MSTSALVIVQDENRVDLCVIYVHSDGYPSGLGAKLKDILGEMLVTDLLSSSRKMGKIANGMEDVAAQVVAMLKTSAGNVYLNPPDSRNMGEFTYYINYPKERNAPLEIKVEDNDGNTLYLGPINEFEPTST